MRKNRLRAALAAGQVVFGTMLQEARSPAAAIILANAGYDFVFVDLEHGVYDLETTAVLISTLRLAGTTALVRVPDAEYHWISRLLDAGAEGVMVPRVESRAQVEYVVNCVKYPPLGRRGCSVTKGHNDYRRGDLGTFTQEANRENLVILQIERREAVEGIEELLSVPGVDVALVGPNDLALSLGVPLDFAHPALHDGITGVIAACRRHHTTCGIHTGSTQDLLAWQREGMQMLMYSTDVDMLISASEQGLAALRRGTVAARAA
jgi:2-keto-3-deoxy-L-rhamnonate aldolase RhmA